MMTARDTNVVNSAAPMQSAMLRLEPLARHHAQGLFNRGRAAGDWRFLPRPCFVDLADTRMWIDEALSVHDQMPLAIVERRKNRAIGSTRFMAMDPVNRTVEIGWTWLGAEWQRTAAHTTAKFLMLCHALDTARYNRVGFRADLRDLRAQRSLERLGAVREGVLRRARLDQRGTPADVVVYSVIAADWTVTRRRLETLLER